MATGIQNWSQTAATNASADSSINFAEGQSPGSVNDSMRALMARMADLYKDMGGLTTAGTATAYTVTTNRAFAASAIMDGAVICIKPNADSGASPTLAADGLTARSLNHSTGVAIPTGALKSGTPYNFIYIHASTEFIFLGAAGALSPLSGPCPVGGIMDFAGSSAPTGWLICNGASLVRASYPALFVAIGTTYGAADGTHFSLPDCTGRVVAGKESSATRLTSGGSGVDGGALGAAGGVQTVTLDTTMMPSHTHTATTSSDGGHTHTVSLQQTNKSGNGSVTCVSGNESLNPAYVPSTSSDGAHTHTLTTAGTGGGAAHNNTQPTIILNKIIFAGV